jgi:hypothetical protein
MVAGHLVELAALLVEPHPEPPLLVEDVAHVQAASRGDAGKREDHRADQGAVAQPYYGTGLDGAQLVAGFLRRQDQGCCPSRASGAAPSRRAL